MKNKKNGRVFISLELLATMIILTELNCPDNLQLDKDDCQKIIAITNNLQDSIKNKSQRNELIPEILSQSDLIDLN